MKNINFQVVTFNVARKLFDMGQTVHYEAVSPNGVTKGSSASKERGDHFIQDVRNCLNEAFLKYNARTMTFKVSVEEIPTLSFEETISNPETWNGSKETYRFINLYMRKGDNLRFVSRYPITPLKDDLKYMQCKSAQHSAAKAKESLILSCGDYFRLNGPSEAHGPLEMIEYANANGYSFNLEETGVIFNDDATSWEFTGSCKNINMPFSYRIYSVKLASDVVRAIRTNTVSMPAKKTA